MANFNISTVFNAINNMTGPIRQMGQSLTQLRNWIRVANTGVNHLGQNQTLTRLQVHFRNLTGLVRGASSAVLNLGSRLAKLATPGLGTLAALGAGAYGGSKLIENSMGFETNEIKTMALLRSRKENKNTPLEQIKQKTLKMIEDNQRFADTQVGETSDWNEWQANMLMNGLTPDNAMRKMAGTFGALHMGGMAGFNESIGSMLRGETSAADQIGQQMKSEKGIISILDPETEKYVKLGAKGTLEYKNALMKFLEKDANKRFGFVSEMMGTSLEARISTLVSTFKTTFDEALRDTGWWENTVKPFADEFNNSILRVKPKIKDLFDTLYKKLGESGLLSTIGKQFDSLLNIGLKTLIDLTNSINTQTIEDFKKWIESLPSAITEVIKQGKDLITTLNELSPSLKTFLESISTLGNIVAHPWDTMNPLSDYDPSTSHRKFVEAQKQAEEAERNKNNSKASLDVTVNTITGQNTVDLKGNGINQPKVITNTGNNTSRAFNPLSNGHY